MKYLLLLLVGCGAGLSNESKADIKNAANDTAAAYKHEDQASPSGALVKAAHCAVQAVIRNEQLEPVDSGIQCQ